MRLLNCSRLLHKKRHFFDIKISPHRSGYHSNNLEITELEKLGSESKNFIPELLEIFSNQSNELVSEMCSNSEIFRYDYVGTAAHKLKGCSHVLGFKDLSHFCQEIETLCAKKETSNIKYYINQAGSIVLQIGIEIDEHLSRVNL